MDVDDIIGNEGVNKFKGEVECEEGIERVDFERFVVRSVKCSF